MIDPLTPADCDLRDFPFMPLDVRRLRDSELAAIEDAEAFRAAVLSWCVAWHQIPAASLPDDDATLCRMLGYGRDLKTWRKARAAGALRGYVLCSDGRLYHTVVAEKALEAWSRKQQQRDRGRRGNEARWGSRKDASGIAEGSPEDRQTIPEGSPDHRKGQGQGEGQGEELPPNPQAGAWGDQVASQSGKGPPPRSRAHGTSPRQVAAAERAAAPPPPEPDHPLWPGFKARGMPAGTFRHMLGRLELMPQTNGHAVLRAPSQWLRDHVLAEHRIALEHVTGQPVEILGPGQEAAHG